MSFLHEKEQEKVRKLVSQYQTIAHAEVSVQTDLVTLCKDVAIQKDEEKSKCACHDILLEKVTNLENKIEQFVSIISLSGKGNQPKHKTPDQDIFSSKDQTTCGFDSSDDESSVMQTISEVASIVSTLPGMVQVPQDETLPGMVQVPQDETAPSRTASIMIYHQLYRHQFMTSFLRKALQYQIIPKILCFLFLIKKNLKTLIVLEHMKRGH